jgi:hypothetical protein
MEDKLEIRVGDVVRLKPMVVRQIDDDGDVFFKGCRGLLDIEAIESIISRAETDADQIARLNRELEEQKADVRAAEKAFDDLQSRYNRLELHSTDLAQRYEAQVNYTQKLEARVGLEDITELEGGIMKPEVPWCPPRLKGYGAWIEGPPPRWMPAGSFQPLAPEERDGKTFYAVRGDYDATEYQHCVAYCIKPSGVWA